MNTALQNLLKIPDHTKAVTIPATASYLIAVGNNHDHFSTTGLAASTALNTINPAVFSGKYFDTESSIGTLFVTKNNHNYLSATGLATAVALNTTTLPALSDKYFNTESSIGSLFVTKSNHDYLSATGLATAVVLNTTTPAVLSNKYFNTESSIGSLFVTKSNQDYLSATGLATAVALNTINPALLSTNYSTIEPSRGYLAATGNKYSLATAGMNSAFTLDTATAAILPSKYAAVGITQSYLAVNQKSNFELATGIAGSIGLQSALINTQMKYNDLLATPSYIGTLGCNHKHLLAVENGLAAVNKTSAFVDAIDYNARAFASAGSISTQLNSLAVGTTNLGTLIAKFPGESAVFNPVWNSKVDTALESAWRYHTYIPGAPTYEEPTTSEDIEINQVLARKLGNVHTAIQESYLGAVHVLNSKGPDYVVHMACSLRRAFSYIVEQLPNKGALIDFVTRNAAKFKEGKYQSQGTRNNSRIVFLFFTEKHPGTLTDDEFMALINQCNTWVHKFTQKPEYETALDIYNRSVDILLYILESHEAVNN